MKTNATTKKKMTEIKSAFVFIAVKDKGAVQQASMPGSLRRNGEMTNYTIYGGFDYAQPP